MSLLDLPVRADHTLDQPYDRLTTEDHSVWRALFERQSSMLRGRACREYLEGVDALGIAADSIPRFDRLSELLERATGWRIVAVPGLLPDDVFFRHLAARRFPATWWIRKPAQMDYLQEPDVFHDLFGHVPMLINPVFADYLQMFGEGGLKALRLNALKNLARLYWYTVEFGLIRTDEGLRIYGSGIVSSKGESIYSLESDSPNRVGFGLMRIMRTRYRIDTFQKTYFVIDSLKSLFDATRPDFTPFYAALDGLSEFGAGDVTASDEVIHRGTREGWSETDDV
jgi:phenylalanine-4-hydroxylase